MKYFSIFFLIVSGLVTIRSKASPGRDTIIVKHTTAFELTGGGESEQWKAATWNIIQQRRDTLNKRETKFKTLYSGKGIYFLFSNQDEVLTASKASDFDSLWLEDVNEAWIKTLFSGILIGASLMLTPAFILFLFGAVQWRVNTIDYSSIVSVTFLFVSIAVAEELLFRGFIFQRLISGIGQWKAQLIIGGLFLLTHLNNPGMTGIIKAFASINIFLASIMFGLAFIRTKSLSMPIGLHFMANWVQGVVLGFGVSGNEQTSILKPGYLSCLHALFHLFAR